MQQSRRAFIGSATAAAATAATAVAGVALIDTPSGHAQNRGRVGAQFDPVVNELLQQLRRSAQELKRGKGEGARQIAQTLRVWAAYGEGRDYNSRFVQTANRMIAQRGRQAIVFATPNHAETERLARQLGVTDIVDLHAQIDPARREQALGRLLKEGVTPSLLAAAAAMDKAGTWLDEHQGSVQQVAFARECSCNDLCSNADVLQGSMEVACAIAALFPELAEICIALTGAWLMMLGVCYMCKAAICWG